jgi:HK97 family phage major capsid protein
MGHFDRTLHKKQVEDRVNDQLDIKELTDALKARDDEIKTFAEKAKSEIDTQGRVLDETKASLERIVKESADVHARLLEVEQKMARRGGPEQIRQRALGRIVSEDEGFKAFAAGRASKARISVKAITSLTTDANGSVGDAINPQRLPGVIAPIDRPMTIRDLLMPGRTSSNAIEYVKETGWTNAAAPVAETAQKPESTLKFDLVTTTVRTIAHWVHASKQVLDDIPMLESYIDQRLRYGLMYAEELQLLQGDGTGQNLLGLIPQATDFDDDLREETDTEIDTVRRAVMQVRLAEYRASAAILNPIDWAKIELTKDADGRYIWANPRFQAQPALWSLPLVDTNAMEEGEFLVGAFNTAAQIFDREDANVEVSTEDRDNFIKNMVTIRGEERLALAVFRPESFVHGEFAAPSP